GDGSSGEGAQTSHTYTTSGSFTAVLTVTSSNGSTSQKDVTVTVGQAPVAVIATTPVSLSGDTPFTVSFDATGSTGDIITYAWDFGDGSSGEGAQTSHTYTTVGSLTAVLTVTSGNGSTSQQEVSVTVTTSETPPVELFNIHIEWSYEYQPTDGCILAGYHLYQEGVKVCTSATPADTAMDCSFASQPGTFNFTLTAFCDDGSESPHSEPFAFTLSESLSPQLAASFTTNPTSLSGIAPFTVAFDGSFSSGAVSYSWEFGDGDTSNESRTEHIFAAAGTYTSTLTVTDRQGGIDSKSVIVTVSEPSGSELAASFTTNPTSLSGIAPFTVAFDGRSSSGAVSYNWAFGDGDTSNESQTQHIFVAAGTYTSTLTVTDSQDNINTKSAIVTVTEDPTENTPPVAVIGSSATTGTVPLNVSFTGAGSHDSEGAIIAYLWNFGDGSPTASGSTTSHQYTAEGTYNASLKVTDNQGATGTVSTSIFVTEPQPENQVPTAKITASTIQGRLPLTVTFDGSASSDPENGALTYSWNFGDGAFGQGEIVNHTYNMPGSVIATLTVTDSMGAVDSASTTIKVLPVFSLEVGEVDIDNNWVQVEITETFVNPIIVTGPPSSNDSQPCVIRLRNIDNTSFEIRLQEWDYLDGDHTGETVAYLILEQGSFTLKDGTLVEAGQFDSQDNNFRSVSFAKAFATEPVVMTSIASFNEDDAVTGRIKNISLTSFEHKIQEQESFSNGHGNETVNYVAWEVSKVNIGNFNTIVNKAARGVKDKWYTVPYGELLPDPPIFLGTMQSQDDADTAAIRYTNKTDSDIKIKIEEEQSADTETRHGLESIGYFLFWNNPVTE
ncbi:MAG: PKD domain-containing protein, partial [Candidatus Electrothrix sp. AUS4]|nr:PKD domain-containing protein [Candidatus Electrothrix sp. AUS4]